MQKEPKTMKNHQGVERDIVDKRVWMYAKPGNQMCPVESFKIYISKRNPLCPAFFQRPSDSFSDEDDIWYQIRPLGKNTLGKMMSILSKAANSSYNHTNYCVRATAITALSDDSFWP